MAASPTIRGAYWKSAARPLLAGRTRDDALLKCAGPGLASQGEFAGAAPRDSPEHGACHQSGASRIIEVEQPADELSRRKETGDRRILDVEHARRRIDLEAAESEGNAAADRVGLERRFLQSIGPVAFVERQPDRRLAVLDVGTE